MLNGVRQSWSWVGAADDCYPFKIRLGSARTAVFPCRSGPWRWWSPRPLTPPPPPPPTLRSLPGWSLCILCRDLSVYVLQILSKYGLYCQNKSTQVAYNSDGKWLHILLIFRTIMCIYRLVPFVSCHFCDVLSKVGAITLLQCSAGRS